ncbi:MAG: helix-turn-helix domain-containing protein [bacterium]
MAIFCLKKLEKSIRVGENFRHTRKQKKISLEQIEKISRIPKKYLLAIETNKINNLPSGKAHCVAYVKRYAEVLGLPVNKTAYQFTQEADLDNYKPSHPGGYIHIRPINSIVLWIKRIFISLAILSFIGYLVWQINGILKPPKLTIFTPVEGYVSNSLIIKIQGQTEKEVSLTINGKEIRADGKGTFQTEIDLSKGLNTITISATKKHGKTTSLTRHVIVKQEIIDSTSIK